MKKGLIISLSIFFGIIAIFIILCFTVFTVKTVQVEFATSQSHAWSEEEIISSAEIPMGKNILFFSKQGHVDKLEKKYPYLEVINIETVFPSKLVIHCAEREEIFAVQREEDYIILDDEFKVLFNGSGAIDSKYENLIKINGLEILNEEVKEGDFLEIRQAGMKKFYSAMLENNRSLSQILGFCKSIELIGEKNYLGLEESAMKLTTNVGREIKILNIDYYLNLKFKKMFFALTNIYEILMENGAFTEEEVDRCSLVIGNEKKTSDTQIIEDSKIYCHIYLDGEIITSPNKTV